MKQSSTKRIAIVDHEGYVNLGKELANCRVVFEKLADGSISIYPAGSENGLQEQQMTFYTDDALKQLDDFNVWESKNPPRGSKDDLRAKKKRS